MPVDGEDARATGQPPPDVVAVAHWAHLAVPLAVRGIDAALRELAMRHPPTHLRMSS